MQYDCNPTLSGKAWGFLRLCPFRVDCKESESDVIDVASLAPLDMETITASVRKTGRALIVQEAPQSSGVAAEITARLWEMILRIPWGARRAGNRLGHHSPGFPRQHFNIPDERRIAAAAESVLQNQW